MKHLVLLVASLVISVAVIAQRTILLHNLWEKPQVHVFFQGYTLSFKISDIDKSLALLAETRDTSFGLTSGLDEKQQYRVQLFQGLDMEYKNSLQRLMQIGVGPFLLLSGRAQVVRGKRKRLKEIIGDISPVKWDDSVAYINFFDPQNNKLIFSGTMAVDMYNKDLGLE